MSGTVKDLKKLLESYPDDMEIWTTSYDEHYAWPGNIVVRESTESKELVLVLE